jgi:hypothetical protein
MAREPLTAGARASLTSDGLIVQSQDTEFVWFGRLKYFPVSPDPWSNGWYSK